jgi:hypothetical protein
VKSLILALASARLTQLVVDDAITEPVRDAIHARPGGEFWSDTLDEVVNCHACTSIWAGAGVLTAEHAGPVGRFLVRVLALSQAALAVKSLIERIDRG